MVQSIEKIVIIGGGQAGAQACMSLRQGGYEGAITLVSEETALPYQRPPLSKAYMKGELSEERLYFKPAAWYEDQNITVRLGVTAEKIDRENRKVLFDDGGHADFDALIIATGSRARKLPVEGASLDHIYDLRTLADVERIRPNLIDGRKLVIVGAGYIGLEAAAVARQMGLDVTVVEMADRVLARVTSPIMSAFFEQVHRDAGVRLMTNTQLDHLKGEGAVSSVVLKGGTELPADMVLVGIGILPNEELAREARLDCENGIVVDENARTSDPAIFACGDCSHRPLEQYDRNGRLESVHNAIEQAKLAAAAILDKPRPPVDCPWFWSDQYELKLQIAGLSQGYESTIMRGDPEERKFAVFYLQGAKVIAVDAINSAPEFMVAKKMILSGKDIDTEQLADMSVPMKDIMASL
jgi:3-phenylpropionate/trans-cinnamate dioxygenase ferredoxin reductase subunit